MNLFDPDVRVALVGNPNCGKTALFNSLTGGRQKVANYPGVTVERKEGRLKTASGNGLSVLDLPGAYSFNATSPDEMITRDVCLGLHLVEPAPDLIIFVADAANLRLHLRFALEVKGLCRPMIFVLNMVDKARKRGIQIDIQALQRQLGVPVIETVAIARNGVRALVECLNQLTQKALPSMLECAQNSEQSKTSDIHKKVQIIMDSAVTMPTHTRTIDDRIDQWALHPAIGLIFLVGLMFLIFQAVFSWAEPMKDFIETGIATLGVWSTQLLPEGGMLHSLLNDGIFSGVGSVIVFLPQILILFFFILVLEDSGYLPRAAFLLDHLMFKAGLTGRAFIPLLSSFACSIPGIMAARSISDPRDRLATILVSPLMTCSARLPVYTLLIAAFIPKREVLGLFNLQGLVLFLLYFSGIISALIVAFVLKCIKRDHMEHALIMELPSYRCPHPRDIFLGLVQRAKIFLQRVGGIILSLTVILWFLSSFPAPPEGATLAPIDYSFAGRIGHWLEYIFAPIGFNWQICVALIPGLAAREIAVASLGTVYALSGSEETVSAQLGSLIANQWSLATALSLLAWYVFAPQCISTLAVIRRETNSTRNMLLATTYLFGLAYIAAFATYQIAGMF